MTYQHRNDQSTAPVESRRRDEITKRFEKDSCFHPIAEEIPTDERTSSSRNSQGARCHGRSTFHFCYRTIYNISLINRLNSVSPNNRSSHTLNRESQSLYPLSLIDFSRILSAPIFATRTHAHTYRLHTQRTHIYTRSSNSLPKTSAALVTIR